MPGTQLYWLPDTANWTEAVNHLEASSEASWDAFVDMARHRLDFVRTAKLDKIAQSSFADAPPMGLPTKPVRLAVLGSATVQHLLPGLRVGALRRNIWCSIHSGDYGQYRQEILAPQSRLPDFKPTCILLTLDARHLLGAISPGIDIGAASDAVAKGVDDLRVLWRRAKERFGCSIIQQTALPIFPTLLGNNEHHLPSAPRRLIEGFNQRVRDAAAEEGVDILALDLRAEEDGLDAWYDPVLWYRAKQEIAVRASPFFGDLVGRLFTARQGRSFKCLALDLDNTLWGGVIGDDGINGIVLGQGSALGEAYVGFQEYVRQLAGRGIIVAVCSKNDQSIATEVFDSHPEMVLRRSDIASFVANWSDKPTNLRRIAEQLNIGLDSIVFVDDNPFERNIVRRELPMVAVPELPEDPALFSRCLADAGYFEATSLTNEDFERTALYQTNAARESLLASTTDLDAYLRSLEMTLVYRPIDEPGMTRVVQLINKTNQFNLTTTRYTEGDIRSIQADERAIALQFRLVDKLGDNGMIAVVIARPANNQGPDILIDTWLMSCRVLGRGVEQATLNVLVDQARQTGFKRIIGEYRPTPKNHMVKDHFRSLGFELLDARQDNSTLWSLSTEGFNPFTPAIELVQK
jgi:FkbH-like protein